MRNLPFSWLLQRQQQQLNGEYHQTNLSQINSSIEIRITIEIEERETNAVNATAIFWTLFVFAPSPTLLLDFLLLLIFFSQVNRNCFGGNFLCYWICLSIFFILVNLNLFLY